MGGKGEEFVQITAPLCSQWQNGTNSREINNKGCSVNESIYIKWNELNGVSADSSERLT